MERERSQKQGSAGHGGGQVPRHSCVEKEGKKSEAKDLLKENGAEEEARLMR